MCLGGQHRACSRRPHICLPAAAAASTQYVPSLTDSRLLLLLWPCPQHYLQQSWLHTLHWLLLGVLIFVGCARRPWRACPEEGCPSGPASQPPPHCSVQVCSTVPGKCLLTPPLRTALLLSLSQVLQRGASCHCACPQWRHGLAGRPSAGQSRAAALSTGRHSAGA